MRFATSAEVAIEHVRFDQQDAACDRKASLNPNGIVKHSDCNGHQSKSWDTPEEDPLIAMAAEAWNKGGQRYDREDHQ